MSRNARAVIAGYAGVLFYAGIVFVAAGHVVYWQGLLYLALAVFGTTLSNVLVPSGSTLTADRAREAEDGEAWDRKLLKTFFLVSLATFVVAGLDSGRFGWSPAMSPLVAGAGAMLMLAGQVLFALAKRQNAFFSSTVRIQNERGHAVCETGLYRIVRHPGYLGMLLSLVAFPLVMGSLWALVPTAAAIGLLVRRTALEDRFLHVELSGYAGYATKTRWRLIPGLC